MPVVQLVERQIVVLVVEGSSPFGHPKREKASLWAGFSVRGAVTLYVVPGKKRLRSATGAAEDKLLGGMLFCLVSTRH